MINKRYQVLVVIGWLGLNFLRPPISLSQPYFERDPLSIHKDGTSITTAIIPFAEGLSVPADKFIRVGTSQSYIYLDTFIIPEFPVLTIESNTQSSTGGISLYLAGGGTTVSDSIGGAITLQGGTVSTSGMGGEIKLSAGTGRGAAYQGGNVRLIGGSALSGATYGYVEVSRGKGIITPNHFNLTSLDTNYSLFIDKWLEVDGMAWFDGGVTIGSLAGMLKASSGLIEAAVAGTDYETPLTFNSPLSRTGDTVSFLFNTNNTWTGSNQFNSAVNLNSLTASRILKLDASKNIDVLTPSSVYSVSNVTIDRSFDADSTKIDELADVLGTLIADLQAAGVLGQ